MINPIKILRETRYLLIFILALLVGILFFYSLIKTGLAPPKPSLPSIPEPRIGKEGAEEFSIAQFRYTGRDVVFPKEMAVLSITEIEEGKKIGQTIAQILSLKTATVSAQLRTPMFRWQNEEITLTYLPAKNKIILDRKIEKGEKPTLAIAQEAAKNFLLQLGLWQDSFILDSDRTQYFQVSGQEYQPASAEKADLVKLFFKQELNGLSLFQTNAQLNPVIILIGPNDSLVELEYFPTVSKTEVFKTYPLIDLAQAISFLNQQKGELVSLYLTDETGLPLTTKDLISADLYRATLVYSFSPDQEKLIPSFVFEGKGVTVNNRPVALTVFLTAIDPDYLAPPQPKSQFPTQ